MSIEVLPVSGLPIFHEGDSISKEICDKIELKDGDILCIASSVYSKTKGFTRV
ncbi:MAG: coenzyme F420-0:L-glutamate ligase, partial [Methanomicrobium sp.]|nr:coenzyme F420-0:L-glutamate ligase [Methanomicrobium sp.]